MYSVKNLSHNKNLDGNLVDNFLDFVTKELGLDQPFSVYFIDDKKNAKDALGKTAMYNPGTKSVYVYATNRHPKDILRSVAHELMHHKQHCDGHLQNMSLEDEEMQANEAGYLLRKYEDGLKKDKLKEQEDQQPARLPGEISITTQDDPEIAFRNVWIEKWEEGKLPFIKNEKQLENFLIKAWNTHQGMMRKREMASASKRMAYAQILDLVGVIPGFGEAADIVSAQIKYDYATRKEASEGLDAAAIYYIDAAISLLAATVVGEGLKLLSVVVKTLGKYGARFSLFVLSKIYKVPPEVVVARIKDGLEIIKKKIGAKFSKVSESADRIGSQLDESLEMITLLRTAEAQLAKFTIENLSKKSTKQIYGMLLRNKVTQKSLQGLLIVLLVPKWQKS